MNFAKYLPIEGEIYQMDKYWDEDDELFTATLPAEEYVGLRKVALFLCSRDINFGDEVIALDTPSIKFIWNEEGLKGATLANSLHLYVKVIGQVSPEAIWVKEGDEFDEYEEFWYHNKTKTFTRYFVSPGDEFTNLGDDIRSGYISPRIKLKCSQCNTFH